MCVFCNDSNWLCVVLSLVACPSTFISFRHTCTCLPTTLNILAPLPLHMTSNNNNNNPDYLITCSKRWLLFQCLSLQLALCTSAVLYQQYDCFQLQLPFQLKLNISILLIYCQCITFINHICSCNQQGWIVQYVCLPIIPSPYLSFPLSLFFPQSHFLTRRGAFWGRLSIFHADTLSLSLPLRGIGPAVRVCVSNSCYIVGVHYAIIWWMAPIDSALTS